jgi:hypothetical protein
MHVNNFDGNWNSRTIRLLNKKRNIQHKLTTKIRKCTSSDLNCKFKLKRNRLGNDRPKAPHNTTQYLTALSEKMCYYPSELELTNYETDIDEICISGGTMKGIFSLINTLDCRHDDESTAVDSDDNTYTFQVD